MPTRVPGANQLIAFRTEKEVGPGFVKSATDWKKGPPFIVLRNKMRGSTHDAPKGR